MASLRFVKRFALTTIRNCQKTGVSMVPFLAAIPENETQYMASFPVQIDVRNSLRVK